MERREHGGCTRDEKSESERGAFEEDGSIGFHSKKFSLWHKPSKRQGTVASLGCWGGLREKGTRCPHAKTIGVPKRGSYGGSGLASQVPVPRVSPFASTISDRERRPRTLPSGHCLSLENRHRSVGHLDSSLHPARRPAPEWWSRLCRVHCIVAFLVTQALRCEISILSLSSHIAARFHLKSVSLAGETRGG